MNQLQLLLLTQPFFRIIGITIHLRWDTRIRLQLSARVIGHIHSIARLCLKRMDAQLLTIIQIPIFFRRHKRQVWLRKPNPQKERCIRCSQLLQHLHGSQRYCPIHIRMVRHIFRQTLRHRPYILFKQILPHCLISHYTLRLRLCTHRFRPQIWIGPNRAQVFKDYPCLRKVWDILNGRLQCILQ